MKYVVTLIIIGQLLACSHSKSIYLQTPDAKGERMTGSEFFSLVSASNWQERDSIAAREILVGNIPDFLKKLPAVYSEMTDSSGRKIKIVFWVMQDYLSLGTGADWARVPLTPMAAQKIADSFNCFLPTRKMVNLIYAQASVKLQPVPMFAFRDSSVTMWQHHLIIEGQRKGRTGLIAGIKKDLVISNKITTDPKPNRVAIYGWHLPGGKPIQPLYTGHINHYVDYSHGIRLVYRKIKVNGTMMDYEQVFKDPVLRKTVCDEDDCTFLRYPY